ncbi:MAG TPA: metalloregulator ArsR/SmtB family transcription factor [Gemmataceae bacterium]|jgi:DNA-binding transcriptional ArsR family regulator|nr:metalloregulator ArsR/SmtB family transcription factor [Gemmataceae bacterium]
MRVRSTTRCAEILKIVADRERLQIVGALFDRPCNVTQLATKLGKPIANVSHHLKVLRRAGLVTGTRSGKFVEYRLASEFFGEPEKPEPSCRLDLGCCSLDLKPSA